MNCHSDRLRFITVALVLLLVSSAVSGCTNPYKSRFDSGPDDLGQRTEQDALDENEARAYGYIRRGGNHHNNKSMELSPFTAAEIARLDGVAVAHVILTDINAYVGAVLDDTATGTAGRGGVKDTDNSGESEGVYDVRDGSPYADPRRIITDRNSNFSYPDEDDISSRLKQRIALKVRELNPHVQEVFISANRDFVNELNGYAIEHWLGKPLDRYIEEFNRKLPIYFPPPSE